MKVRCLQRWTATADEFLRLLSGRQSGGVLHYEAGVEYPVVADVGKWLLEYAAPYFVEVVEEEPAAREPEEPYLSIIW